MIRPTGLGWSAFGLTMLTVLMMVVGVELGQVWAQSNAFPAPVLPRSLADSQRIWNDSWPITKIFPWFGTGMGTFGSIYPAFKNQDASSTTAMSSLLQWWVEAGFLGVGILGLGGLWCLIKLPRAIRKVGTADRSLVFGLIASAVGFTLYSITQWTIELTSVALAASALCG